MFISTCYSFFNAEKVLGKWRNSKITGVLSCALDFDEPSSQMTMHPTHTSPSSLPIPPPNHSGSESHTKGIFTNFGLVTLLVLFYIFFFSALQVLLKSFLRFYHRIKHFINLFLLGYVFFLDRDIGRGFVNAKTKIQYSHQIVTQKQVRTRGGKSDLFKAFVKIDSSRKFNFNK